MVGGTHKHSVFFTLFYLAFFAFFSKAALADKRLPPPIQKDPKPISGVADPLFDKAWHLQQLEMLEAWKVSYGSPRTVLAVIDSGVNYNHPELVHRIRRKKIEWPLNQMDDDGNGYVDDFIGWDFVKGHHLPMDRTGHGTAMAAIMAGTFGNGHGAAGICPKCSILPVRFINWEGLGDTEDAILGMKYAIFEGASVINVSFAGEGYDEDLLSVIRLADKKDVVVVVAAGNDGESLDKSSVYPAKFQEPNLLTVAALDEEKEILETSNWSHKYVSIAAPGDEILEPWYDKWDTGSGTSQATAVVAGAVGLIRSINPELTARQVVSIIRATASQHKHLQKKVSRGGSLNVVRAVKCASQKTLPCLR